MSGGGADEERAIFGHCQFKRASHPRNVGQIRRVFAVAAATAEVERARGGSLEMMEQVLMEPDCRRARKEVSMALQTDIQTDEGAGAHDEVLNQMRQI